MNIKIPEYIRDGIYKYKYILLMCAAGILLVLLSGIGEVKTTSDNENRLDTEYDVTEIEKAAESIRIKKLKKKK